MPSWQPDLIKTVLGGVMIAFWFLARSGFRRGPSAAGYDIPVPEAPAGPDLLGGAQCAGRALNVTQERCFWVNDEQALFLRRKRGDPPYHALLQDRSGSAVPLDIFNERHGARLQGPRVGVVMEGGTREPAQVSPPEAALSPDGRWLLWEDQQNAARGAWIAARLDGTEEKTWSTNLLADWFNGGVAWTLAGDRWLELLLSPRWRRQIVSGVRTHGIDGSIGERVAVQPSTPSGLLCGITARDELVLRSAEPYQSLKAHDLWLLDPASGRTTKTALSLPHRAVIEEMRLSRAGDRFALLLSTSIERSFFPRRYALWTCALGGSDWSLVGVVDGRAVEDPGSPSGQRYAWPQELCWLPSGREVSFVFDERLFIVPVTTVSPAEDTTR
jgi:hypothetical protein